MATVPPAEQPTTGNAATDSGLAPGAPSPGEDTSTGKASTSPGTATKAAEPAQDTSKKATRPSQDTTKKAAAKKPAAGGAQSPQQIALGDSIFHGQVAGGTCTACHGQDAKGTAVAPNLTDSQWLNGDGSYEFIVNTVTSGVPKPKEHPAPMPPKGGAQLTDDQVKAVAAYVYSLSHKS
jgi:mono/diheme cytochrome c family protein